MEKVANGKVYRSNLTCPDLEPCFEAVRILKPVARGHFMLADKDDLRCGFISHDEAAVLHEVVKRAGGWWLEIGSHVGWSAAHMAMGADHVVCVDPSFGEEKWMSKFTQNILRVGVYLDITVAAMRSDTYFKTHMKGSSPSYTGVFIDGMHSDPVPYEDAVGSVRILNRDLSVIVFHDVGGAPIRRGVRYCIDAGYKFRMYNTPNFMAVCWKGNFDPPIHKPDPSIPWEKIRQNMPELDFREES